MDEGDSERGEGAGQAHVKRRVTKITKVKNGVAGNVTI
jgi:hypothetical protein